MRNPLFDRSAPKRTVSLTLNSELYAKAKALGINASRVAEEALAQAYVERCAATVRAELQQDLRAVDDYAGTHGSFAELARRHYETDDGAV
jgi:post-segregation antitoxin (ccd killing protein)